MKEPQSPFDFDADLNEANQINDLHERLLFLKKRLKEFNQHHAHELDLYTWFYPKQATAEINYVMDLINMKHRQGQSKAAPVKTHPTSKIDWKNNERLIPYLIHLLNEAGFLKEKNQFALIEEHFTAKGKPIKRVNLKTNYQQADYLNKKLSKTPKEIMQLNEIAEKLKKLNDILNSL